MDIKQQTKNVAAQGRYGDSMLLHVNPAEVKGLASAMPITINPETGQPEAFLPFLAPIAGSLIGGSLLGGTLGTLGASALGSGLAQYAATGDLKKGLLAGLTGYGLGTALQGAAGAAGASAASQAATDVATTAGTLGEVATQEAIQSAATQAGGEAVKAAATQTPFQNLQSVFNPAAITETTAATAPDLLTAGTIPDPTLGTSFGNLATGLAQPMSYIPIGIGMGGTGIMESQEAFERMIGESEEAYRRRREQNLLNNPEPILYSAEGGRTGYFMGGDIRAAVDSVGGRDITGGNLPQIFAPAKQAYDVNPDFMAGFAPETMYFNPATISAPASGLQAGAPPIGIDTYQGSKGGYGGRQASIAPQVSIDPYSAYTGSAPKGLEFTEAPMPEPIQPLPVMPITPPDFGINPIDIGGIPSIPGLGTLDIQSIIDGLEDYNRPERFMPITGKDLGITAPPIMQANTNPVLEMPPVVSLPDFNTPVTPVVPTLENITAPSLDVPVMPALDVLDPVVAKQVVDIPTYNYNDPARLARRDAYFASDRFASASGGSTNFKEGGALKPIPEDNKGLPNLPEDVRNEMGYMQAGGMTDIQNDPLTQEVTMFILGETDNEQALNDFITKYGSDTFMQLREAVLQSIVPNAQTQGLIRGDGEGGMDDDLRGMIGNKERIAVSQDEFIVPADVVSMLGDGSSDAGSKELYDMMDRVRKEKTGTTKQAPKLANAGGLLPA